MNFFNYDIEFGESDTLDIEENSAALDILILKNWAAKLVQLVDWIVMKKVHWTLKLKHWAFESMQCWS